jgi:tetratricopeptide (TPR) repeat protein
LPHFSQATAYYSQGNYALALNDLSRSLELVPDHFVFYLNRSIIYNKMGNGDRAVADFEAAMRLNPQNFMTHFNQSLLLLPQEPEVDPTLPPTTPTPMKVVRGKLHRNLNKLCMAVYEFCAEMELQPNADTSDQVQNDILDLMLRLYQQAIDRDPDNVLLYWDRSCLLIDAQKLEFAIADLLQAIKLAPQNAVLWLNCGIAYYKKLNFSQALSYFSQALALNPRMIEAYANRAIVYIALNRLSDARVDLDQAMQIAPDQAFLLQLRASLPLLVD